MTTSTALDDMFDDAERGLEWLEKLEALQARSASDQAAIEVAEYVMKLRTAVTELAGDRSAADLGESVGSDTAALVEELREVGDRDYWNTRILPALRKTNT
ncbi:MAG: hypothetical protein OXI91_01470 [Chloroflexota bacterium]|nr:hypothetical protein [Chloroflexota bacterium]